jgi:hypothetical protein
VEGTTFSDGVGFASYSLSHTTGAHMSCIIKGRKDYFNYNLDNEIGRGRVSVPIEIFLSTPTGPLGIRR